MIITVIDRVTVDKVETTENVRENETPKKVAGESKPTLTKPEKGFCIRCKADLPAKPTKPYCRPCHVSWNKFKNKDFEEKCCHTCGNEHATTLLKPLCLACYGKYKDVFEFAAR